MATGGEHLEASLLSQEKLSSSPELWPEQKNLEASLLSQEKLRSSPELWPEQIPGVLDFVAMASPTSGSDVAQAEWLKDLDQEDFNVLQGFGSLTAAALLEKVKDLQNLAYQLGLEEAHEMTRGKFLNILEKTPRWRK